MQWQKRLNKKEGEISILRTQLSNSEKKLAKLQQEMTALNDSFQCAICMESFLTRDPVNGDCGHIFCRACIDQWFKETKSTCPTCRTKITILRPLKGLGQ